MKKNYELYDGKGNLIEQKEIDVPDPAPSDLEIRLSAIEKKIGITEEDKQSAKIELMEGGK